MLRPVTDLNNALADYTDRGDSAQEALTRASVGWTGKNELHIDDSFITTTTPINGITLVVTRNGAGEVTEIDADGTASERVFLPLNTVKISTHGKTKVGSGAPGLSNRLLIFDKFVGGVHDSYYTDLGSGVNIPSNDGDEIQVFLDIRSGAVCDHDKFYPMLRDARIKDSTFEPYHESVDVCKFDRAEQRVLGAKNLLENTATTQTISGVTFTVNTDKSVTLNGTSTDEIKYIIHSYADNEWENTPLKIMTGCPKGGSNTSYRLRWIRDGSFSRNDTGDGVLLDYNTSAGLQVRIEIASGQTFNNAVFKPMIRLASDPDDTYVPYAMTNKELTDVDTRTIVASKLFLQRCGMVKRLICRGCTYAEVKAVELPVEFRPAMRADIPFSIMLRTAGGIYYTGVISYVESTHAFTDSVYVSTYGGNRTSTPDDMQLFTSLTWI